MVLPALRRRMTGRNRTDLCRSIRQIRAGQVEAMDTSVSFLAPPRDLRFSWDGEGGTEPSMTRSCPPKRSALRKAAR